VLRPFAAEALILEKLFYAFPPGIIKVKAAESKIYPIPMLLYENKDFYEAFYKD
jgi:hypothetical protein